MKHDLQSRTFLGTDGPKIIGKWNDIKQIFLILTKSVKKKVNYNFFENVLTVYYF